MWYLRQRAIEWLLAKICGRPPSRRAERPDAGTGDHIRLTQLVEAGDYVAALKLCTRMINDCQNAELLLVRSQIKERLGVAGSALDLAAAQLVDPTCPQTYRHLARKLSLAGEDKLCQLALRQGWVLYRRLVPLASREEHDRFWDVNGPEETMRVSSVDDPPC